MKNLLNIRFVLMETSHPGNIGATARALKTMGLKSLYLVNPSDFPSGEATARASGADDVLDSAVICHSLDEALAECQWVFGCSARLRTLEWPQVNPRECAEQIRDQATADEQIAIVLGREHSGLSNEELDRCHFLVHIPANPQYQSLNLAAAAQVLAYEINMAFRAEQGSVKDQDDYYGGADEPAALAEDVEKFYQRLEKVLFELEFLKPPGYHKLMRRLRRLYNRARLTPTELNILHGILTAALGRKYEWTRRNRLRVDE